jgi:radical SAM protein with 4Fe4S-binding SPASM domain
MRFRMLNRIFRFKEIWALRYSFLYLLPRFFRISLLINSLSVYLSKLLRLTRIIGMPYMIMLEPTSRCNMLCPMCARTFVGLNNRQERDMTFAEFKTVFDKLEKYLVLISFWNIGEPFLNKDLLTMVNYAHKRRVFSSVLTNGTVLEPEKSRQIIACGLDYLAVSIDGATEESYKKYRKGGDFKRLMENIRFLVSEKKRQKKSNPFIEIVFLVMRDNEHELENMVRLARELGINRLSFKKVSLISAEQLVDFSAILPQNREFLHNVHKPDYVRKKSCSSPWEQLVINADGNVTACCSDFFHAESMGNLFTETADNIWNGDKFQGFRQRIIKDFENIKACRDNCSENNLDSDIFFCADI